MTWRCRHGAEPRRGTRHWRRLDGRGARVWTAADGKRAGTLSPNPPTVAEQFEAAAKELVAAAVRKKQREVAAKASKDAADKANADLAAAQKAVAQMPAPSRRLTMWWPERRRTWTGPRRLKAGQAEESAKAVLAKALAETAAKVKAAADKGRPTRPWRRQRPVPANWRPRLLPR